MANPNAGRFVWHEVMSQDLKKALSFYTALFGWTVKEMDISGGKYHMLMKGETPVGGAMDASPGRACVLDDVDGRGGRRRGGQADRRARRQAAHAADDGAGHGPLRRRDGSARRIVRRRAGARSEREHAADANTKKTKDLGGKVMMEPVDMAKVGKFSVVQDPTGATFALFRSAHV